MNDKDKFYKYAIILVEVSNLDAKILSICNTFSDAVEYMYNYVDTSYNLSNYLKCFHNNKNCCSIYKYYLIYPKELVCKLHIVQFVD